MQDEVVKAIITRLGHDHEELNKENLKKLLSDLFDNPLIADHLCKTPKYQMYQVHSILWIQNKNIDILNEAVSKLLLHRKLLILYAPWINKKFRESLINLIIDPKLTDDKIRDENGVEEVYEKFPVEIFMEKVGCFLDQISCILPFYKTWIGKIKEKIAELKKKNEKELFRKRQNSLKKYINEGVGDDEGKILFNKNVVNQQKQCYETFRYSLISYVMKNASSNIIEKLQKSCKLFHLKLPYAIFQRVTLNAFNEIEFVNNSSKFLMPGTELLKDVKSLIIKEGIEIYSEKFIHELLSKIYKCNIRVLCISTIGIKFHLYKTLTKLGNLRKLMLDLVLITDEKDKKIPLEDLLAEVPNVDKIDLHGCHVTPDTMFKLNLIPFKRKLSSFFLTFLP